MSRSTGCARATAHAAFVRPCTSERAEAHLSALSPSPSFPLPRGEREASRGALRAHLLLSGFTLIELVVVLLILSIILGLAGIRLTRDQGDTLRDEARRLALVLQNAQQQAVLEGRPYAFALTDDGYRFLQLNSKGRLVPIETDELLAPRKLPSPMTLDPLKKSEDTKKRVDLIVFDPSGEFPAFTMVLSIGQLNWYVRGRNDGQIQSSPLLEAAA